MKIFTQFCQRIINEWELTMLAIVCIAGAVLLGVFMLSTAPPESSPDPARSLPIKQPQINTTSGYAFLENNDISRLTSPHAFKSGFASSAKHPPSSPEPDISKSSSSKPTEPSPPPEDKQDEVEGPGKTSDTGPEQKQKKVHTYKYIGYEHTPEGDKIGLMYNVDTGEHINLRIGSRWGRLMVSGIRATEVVFLTPQGREHTLKAHREVQIDVNK